MDYTKVCPSHICLPFPVESAAVSASPRNVGAVAAQPNVAMLGGSEAVGTIGCGSMDDVEATCLQCAGWRGCVLLSLEAIGHAEEL